MHGNHCTLQWALGTGLCKMLVQESPQGDWDLPSRQVAKVEEGRAYVSRGMGISTHCQCGRQPGHRKRTFMSLILGSG